MSRSQASIIELRPNRKLLDHNFDGYKLNLLSLPHWNLDLQSPVDKVYPDDAQYSFIHAKLFALHNHLVADKWSHHYSFYYIDKDQQVVHITFDQNNYSFSFKKVYDIPAHVERNPGHFNLCLMFPSNMLAVVSDGTGYLHIVSTDIRAASDQQIWKTLHSELILEKDKYFVILDSRTQNEGNKLILHCVLQSVNQVTNHFCSILTWVSFELVEDNWKRIVTKQLEGKGIVHYAAIETTFRALYIVSDNQFPVISDSEKETEESETGDPKPKKYLYSWMQNCEDDITITLQLPDKFNRKEFNINISPTNIRVTYGDMVYLDGSLLHKVDTELTTWTVHDNGHVEIMLLKSSPGLWPSLLQIPDPNGQEVLDQEMVKSTHLRLAHLCSETEPDEEAPPQLPLQDMEIIDADAKDTTLVRLDIKNHRVTHKANLSVQQYLFSINIDPLQVPSIVIQQDIDACVWQPYAKMPEENKWNLQHQGTLKAFGYIQSSKTNKKFMCSPPNFSYSVVCEASRHIFVYNSLENGSQLRKRSPGKEVKNVKVGQQFVINIDEYGEVLGVSATNSFLFLLTDKSVVSINMSLP